MYNLYNTEAQFKAFLISGNISNVSIRNYLSDFRYFCGWYQMLHGKEPIETTLKNGFDLQASFETYLKDAHTPLKTLKRRLSTLRKFFAFLQSEGLIDLNTRDLASNDVMSSRQRNRLISNNGKLVSDFKYDLLMADDVEQAEIILDNVNDFITYITHD